MSVNGTKWANHQVYFRHTSITFWFDDDCCNYKWWCEIFIVLSSLKHQYTQQMSRSIRNQFPNMDFNVIYFAENTQIPMFAHTSKLVRDLPHSPLPPSNLFAKKTYLILRRNKARTFNQWYMHCLQSRHHLCVL